jgi:hypothetical protein
LEDVRHPSDQVRCHDQVEKKPKRKVLKVEKIYVETFPFDATKELMDYYGGIGEVLEVYTHQSRH